MASYSATPTERSIPPSGSRYKATVDGLHRKPIKYVFGAEYGPVFVAANKQARKARGGDPHARRAGLRRPEPRSRLRPFWRPRGLTHPKTQA